MEKVAGAPEATGCVSSCRVNGLTFFLFFVFSLWRGVTAQKLSSSLVQFYRTMSGLVATTTGSFETGSSCTSALKNGGVDEDSEREHLLLSKSNQWVINQCPTFCCCNSGKCVPNDCCEKAMQFVDEDLERRYSHFYVVGRRKIVTAVCLTVGAFTLCLLVFQARSWHLWLQDAPEIPLLNFFFGLKAASQSILLIIFLSAAVTINADATTARWQSLSTAYLVTYAVVCQGLLLATSVVAFLCTTVTDGNCTTTRFEQSLGGCPQSLNETDSALLYLWDDVMSSTVKTNSASISLAPVFALAFAAPVRSYASVMVVQVLVIAIPNIVLVSYDVILKMISITSEGNSTVDFANEMYADLSYSAASSVLQVSIVMTICVNLMMNFDSLLRSAFLVRHVVQQERNDLNAKANPFAPRELEKWYKEKQRTYIMDADSVGASESHLAKVLIPDQYETKHPKQKKFSWDLNYQDLVLGDTIAVGAAGSVIAATYNGLDVAVKVCSCCKHSGLTSVHG